MSNNREATFGQALQFLNLINQKGLTREKIEQLFQTGILSDLLEAEPYSIDREALKKFLKLPNFIISVSRSNKPEYPDFVKSIIHPELECKGPEEYVLSNVGEWRPETDIFTRGIDIYNSLKKSGQLTLCLNLQDANAIKNKGLEVCKKFFQWKKPVFWASVAEDYAGNLHAPYFRSMHDYHQLDIVWVKLHDTTFNSGDVALYFKS